MSERPELLPFVRKKVGDFLYPYGSFPDEHYEQHEGFELEDHTTDSEDGLGSHYRIEILVSAEKLVPLWLDLCTLLPERIRVSLDRTSADIYSRWDEFVSGDVSRQEFLSTFATYQFAFTEDGNLGLGAFAPEAALELFLGSHKEIVLFTADPDPVREILRQHKVRPRSLEPYYQRDHQHLALTDYRGLRGPRFDYLQVADDVRRALGMRLHADEDENVDDEGRPLGLVAWHAIALVAPARRARAWRRRNRAFVQGFGLTARSRREARQILERRLGQDGCVLQDLEELFRIDVGVLPAHVQPPAEALAKPGVWYVGDKADAGLDP